MLPFAAFFLSCSLSRKCLVLFLFPLVFYSLFLSSPVCSTTCISYLIFIPSFSPCFYFPIFITPPLYFPSFFPFTPIILVLFTPIPLLRKFIPCFSFVSSSYSGHLYSSEIPYCFITYFFPAPLFSHSFLNYFSSFRFFLFSQSPSLPVIFLPFRPPFPPLTSPLVICCTAFPVFSQSLAVTFASRRP